MPFNPDDLVGMLRDAGYAPRAVYLGDGTPRTPVVGVEVFDASELVLLGANVMLEAKLDPASVDDVTYGEAFADFLALTSIYEIDERLIAYWPTLAWQDTLKEQ